MTDFHLNQLVDCGWSARIIVTQEAGMFKIYRCYLRWNPNTFARVSTTALTDDTGTLVPCQVFAFG